MSGSLMQYTCCDWDIIDKTSYNYQRKSVIRFESTILLLRVLTSCCFFNCIVKEALITFLGVI